MTDQRSAAVATSVAWLGLVPRQISTGDRTVLGRISSVENRMLFVQAPRVVLLRPAWPKHNFGRWLKAAVKRMHHNIVAAALANKLTRIAWSVLCHGRFVESRRGLPEEQERGTVSPAYR